MSNSYHGCRGILPQCLLPLPTNSIITHTTITLNTLSPIFQHHQHHLFLCLLPHVLQPITVPLSSHLPLVQMPCIPNTSWTPSSNFQTSFYCCQTRPTYHVLTNPKHRSLDTSTQSPCQLERSSLFLFMDDQKMLPSNLIYIDIFYDKKMVYL